MTTAEKNGGEGKLTRPMKNKNKEKKNQYYGLVCSKCYDGVVGFFEKKVLLLCISAG